ncbi:restriction endonuclease subunit S [Streptomonospora arabica]|uniref:Restriction endonuclease subunit S n=1 Tax=Streptomonospora arabica TaxID=412417 RepID=A0ABV9SU04_9ACTN
MVPYLRAANVKDGRIDLSSVLEMNFSPQEQQIFSLRAGDVLVTEGSGSLGTVGASAVWRGELEGTVCFQNTLLRLRPRQDVDGRYLSWWARSAHGSGLFASVASGANIYHLSAERVRALPVSLPPVDEQRRIADYLDAETARIDEMIKLRNRQMLIISERYRAAISENTTPGISQNVRRSEAWPWLPNDMPTARLGYLARIQSGATVDATRKATPDDIEVPYLRVANVQGEGIDLSEIKTINLPKSAIRRSTLQPGDVVMTEANGNPDNLGRGAVWNDDIPGMVHQNHIFAIRTNKDSLLPDFLSSTLASIHGRKYFRFTSNQVGIATTSGSKVLDFPVPVVDMKKQKSIASECAKMRESTNRIFDTLNHQISLLAERRQALITAAVTGQIDVTTAGRAAVG